MIVNWLGQTWGEGDVVIESAQGVEDFVASAANVSGGRDGVVAAPLFQGAGGWVLPLRVLADSDADMEAKLDEIYAVTCGPANRMAEDPFTFTMRGGATKTIFARVTNRQPATDFTTASRYRAALVQITFEATDPTRYGDAVDVDLDLDTPVSFTPGGWAASQRWRWIAHGPLVNPKIVIAADGQPDQVLRFVGHVNTGQNLLWDSSPGALDSSVGGLYEYGAFDGGDHNIDPPIIALGTGEQTITMTADSGSGDGSFRYRKAIP